MIDGSVMSPEIFHSFPEVRCGLSTRTGGVSPEPLGMNLSYNVGDEPANVKMNRSSFYQRLEIDGEKLAVPKQCHSARVVYAKKPGVFDATDGLITDQRNVWLAVTVADCVPVFLFDPLKGAVAGIHAGWRGSAAGIVGRGVGLMQEEFLSDPVDLRVFIGPSAGPCCYEVGGNVAEQFENGTLVRREGKLFLDLKNEVRSQLLSKGVPQRNIETSSFCTICSPQLFHSYRRDGERSGRMMGIIGMRG